MFNILIIEDDCIIRQELKILLDKYGYNANATDDFKGVVDFILNSNPHLVLLDINLPLFDGYFICREIRKQSKVPIIIVTSRTSDIDELMSMNLGADDFIAKPYNTQILIARISAILNRVYDTEDLKVVRFGELILDIGKSCVSFKENTVEITKNELRILDLLIKNKGVVTSRNEIMNALWQSDEFVDDNTLTVNINRLRKKMLEIGAGDYIKTKRGLGYLLCQ